MENLYKPAPAPYGYMTPQNDSVVVQMKKGQNIAGFPIGIIYIEDVFYPMLPGNIVNGYTFPFPVRLVLLPCLPDSFQRIHMHH